MLMASDFWTPPDLPYVQVFLLTTLALVTLFHRNRLAVFYHPDNRLESKNSILE